MEGASAFVFEQGHRRIEIQRDIIVHKNGASVVSLSLLV